MASSAYGRGGCRIGEPADGGLYFQLGSLIGWKGGALANGGTGVGSNPYTGSATQYWDGATAWSWDNEAMVWPTAMSKKAPTAWPSNYGSKEGDRTTVVDQWFFNCNSKPYSTAGQNIHGFSEKFEGDTGQDSLAAGRYAVWGIGDPCTYYLGDTWRLPKNAEYFALFGNVANGTVWGSVAGWNWQATPPGAMGSLFFPAFGHRNTWNT